MKSFLLNTLILCVLGVPTLAQEAQPKYLRLLPLGELPIWKERPLVDDGIRADPVPEPGTLPPRSTSLFSGDSLIPFELRLRTFTKPMNIDPASEGLEVRISEKSKSTTWFEAAKPTAPLSLGVLYCDPKTMLWDKPKMMMLRDDAKSFPAGTVRFMNVSDKSVMVKLGGPESKVFGVRPGNFVIKPVVDGMVRIGYQTTAGAVKIIWQNHLKVLGNQRVQCFFYKAIPQKGRHAIKFHYAPEHIPKPAGKADAKSSGK